MSSRSCRFQYFEARQRGVWFVGAERQEDWLFRLCELLEHLAVRDATAALKSAVFSMDRVNLSMIMGRLADSAHLWSFYAALTLSPDLQFYIIVILWY